MFLLLAAAAALLAGVVLGSQPVYAGLPAPALRIPPSNITALFQYYFPRIEKAPPPDYDLAVSRIELIQGATMSPAYRVHVANRPALLRVFASLQGVAPLPGVVARLTRYVNGAPFDVLETGPVNVNAAADEGDLLQTFNFSLPAHWLLPGTSYVVELDPHYAVSEFSETNNRYPPLGAQAFDFQVAPVLEVVIVPVIYKGVAPNVGDLSYLTWMPIKVFPVANIVYTVRAGHVFNGNLGSGNEWGNLLREITTIHNWEDPGQQKAYYGLVDSVAVDGCSGGCIAGIGWVNHPSNAYVLKTAAGFAGFPSNRNESSPTFTHEMGHVFGRPHAPCGQVSGQDFSYPYFPDANIGQWGLDTSIGQLLSPLVYRDYMSYCGPEWTSDYTYRKLFDAWGWASQTQGQAQANGAGPSLTVSGNVQPDGSLDLDPLFSEPAVAGDENEDGRYSVRLLDRAGELLAASRFEPRQVALDGTDDGQMILGFRLSVPLVDAALIQIYEGEMLVFERRAAGSAPALDGDVVASAAPGGASLSWSLAGESPGVSYRVLFSPDGGASFVVLAANSPHPDVEVPAALLTGARQPQLWVQASDGVATTQRIFNVPARLNSPH